MLLVWPLIVQANSIQVGTSWCAELGGRGIKAKVMVDGLNKYTETLPDYFVLIIWLVIKDKMKFKIEFKSVSLSHLMGLVSFKYTIQKKGDFGEIWNIKEVQAILISDLLKLCIFRYKKKI